MSDPYDFGEKKSMSILGPSLSFKGELRAEEDLLIQGKVEGSIEHTSNLTIGEQGKIKADVKAEFIAVEGKVTGDLKGTKSIVIKDTAEVDGNIFSPTVSLHEGATFNGKIDMSGKEPAVKQLPEPKAEVEEVEAANDADKPVEANKPNQAKKRATNAA
jgi:cytoskeletal protein CcmA (bactofilin family)